MVPILDRSNKDCLLKMDNENRKVNQYSLITNPKEKEPIPNDYNEFICNDDENEHEDHKDGQKIDD